MKRKHNAVRTLAGAVAVATCLGLASPALAAASPSAGPSANAKPVTIPALQSWTGGNGQLTLKSHSKIVVSHRDAARLLPVARLLATDLRSRTGVRADVVVNEGSGGKGDIVLDLDRHVTGVGSEGYELTIGRTAQVSATTSDGVFYGTQTLLQVLGTGTTLPTGTAKDSPQYPERGLMVDIARMYFSLDWLEARVRDMAYLKLNTLSLHLTDDEGWGVQSNLGIQRTQSLSKKEVAQLVAYAAKYHVTVIPEIDMPAHLGKLLEKYPQYRLVDKDGNVSPTKIDFTIPGAEALLKRVIAEYLPLFPGAYWHIGNDEYLANSQFANYPQLQQWAKAHVGPNATAKDAVIEFANQMNDFVRHFGKTARMWNDNVGPGTTIEPDTNIVIQFWTDSDSEDYFGPNGPYTPQALLDMGYKIVNDSFLYTYTAPPGGQSEVATAGYQYDNWAVDKFYGYLFLNLGGGNIIKPLPDKTVAPGAPGFLGASLNMWNSGGTWTQDEGAADIYPRLRVMAQKTWGSPQLAATYADFQPIIDQVGSAS